MAAKHASVPLAALAPPVWVADSSSNLAQTQAILWTMIGISVAGAIVTFGILVYALKKFQDPETRRRRYG